MISLILSFLTLAHLGFASGSIDSDCKADELKMLKSEDVVKQFAVEAKLVDIDCTVVRSPKQNEKLLVLLKINSLDGLQTFVGLFSRANLKSTSLARFKSESLGVDSFPFVVNAKHRLIFVLPENELDSVSFYTCIQGSDGQVNFLKRKLNQKLLTVANVDDHKWAVDAEKPPKLFLEKGKWRAIVKSKIVDL